MFFAAEIYGELQNIKLNLIDPDPNQPRRSISAIYGEVREGAEEIISQQPDPEIDAELNLDDERERPGAENVSSLADSILANGVLQPITIRPHGKKRWMIVTGERRWRAAVAAQKRINSGNVDHDKLRDGYDYDSIPAIVTKSGGNDDDRLTAQLVENIQRTNMSMDDIGVALNRLRDRGLSIRDIAAKLGRSSAFVQSALCAASEEGKSTAAELRTTDWQWVRRMITRKREAPIVYKQILQRVRNGESFSRRMYESVNESYKEEKEFARRAETRSRFGNRPKPAPIDDGGEEDDQYQGAAIPGADIEYDTGPDPVSADALIATPREPVESTAAKPRPEFVAKNKAEKTKEERLKALYDYAYVSYISYFVMGEGDDYSAQEMEPDGFDTSPPEPIVDILVRLPRSEADLLAGVLDAVMVEIKKQKGLPNRRVRPVPGEKGSAIAERLKNLVKAFE